MHPPPLTAWANFTLMMECTLESSCCNSVYSVAPNDDLFLLSFPTYSGATSEAFRDFHITTGGWLVSLSFLLNKGEARVCLAE